MVSRRWKKIAFFLVHPGSFLSWHDFPIFLFCLLVSSGLWLIIRFSQPYEQIINVPLTYTGIGKNLALVSFSDSVLTLKASIRGIQIVNFRYIHQPQPYSIDVTSLKARQIHPLRYKAILPVGQLLPDIAQKLGIGGQITVIDPDTLSFILEKRMTRRLPVHVDVIYTIPPGMMLADSLLVKPPKVEVTGPASVLDTLRNLHTITTNLGQVVKDHTFQLSLRKPIESLPFIIEPSKVEVSVLVDKFTEVLAEVPVSLPDSTECRLKIIPEKVKLHLVMPMRRFREFEPSICRVGVSCPSTGNQSAITLPVQILQLPAYVRCLEMEPPMVEFLILD